MPTLTFSYECLRPKRANDYPHHEGSWPHSQPAIERHMGKLTDDERAKVLGLNAARLFGFDVAKLLAYRAADAGGK